MFREFSINGTAPKTYTDFLKNSNMALYNVLMNCDAIQKETERRQEITRVINFIVEDIYVYLDKDIFKYVFNSIPTVNLDYIRQYIFLIINFFKSYKVDVINANIIYKFDDRLHNKVRIYDKIIFNYLYTRTDKIPVSDCINFLNHFDWREQIPVIDKMLLDITYWKEKHFYDNVPVDDKDHWKEILVTFDAWHDHIFVNDIVTQMNHNYTWGDRLAPIDCMKPTSRVTYKDRINVDESIYFIYRDEHEPLT